MGSDLFFQTSNSRILWSSKHCFPSLIKLSKWDKSGFAGCSLNETQNACWITFVGVNYAQQ